MDRTSPSDRDTAVVAAIGRGVALQIVCATYGLDATTIRRTVEAAGQPMPIDVPGPMALIAPRESEMLRRALNGEDFSVIGRAANVSREWVRLVVKKHTGLSAKDLQEARDVARRQFKTQRLRDLAGKDADLSLDQLARESGLSVRDAAAALGSAEAARRRRGRSVTTAMERDRVVADLNRVASLPGGRPLSGPFYDNHRGEGLTSARIVQIYETWSNACEEAGVEAPSPPRPTYNRAWSREDCLRAVLDYLSSTKNPTFGGYDRWAREKEGAPSSGTVRLRCGRWIATVSDAYKLAAGEALGVVRGAADVSIERGDASSSSPVSGGGSTLGEPAWNVGDAPPEEPTGQSRQSDVETRLKVEAAAQERLMAHYRDRGWQVVDTHRDSPYDAVATKGDQTRYLEAKGTQSAGDTVLVTRGEVEHALRNFGECWMGIWSGIELDDNGVVRPEAGEFRVVPFRPQADDLVVISYEWRPQQRREHHGGWGPTSKDVAGSCGGA